MLETYITKIFKTGQRGDAREESYYPALKEMLESYAQSIGKKKAVITSQPKKTEGGNPDFRVWDGEQSIAGYIEAKDPSITHLDQVETTEQLKRYLNIFPNLILTNFYEFRLYRNGIEIDRVLIARHSIAKKVKVVPPVENEENFLKLLEKFFAFSLPSITTAKELAVELAKRTRFLRDEVISEEIKIGKSQLLRFYDAFKEFLISGLTKEDFADLYSQTVTYGLFAARTRSQNGFNRKLAYDNIPRTIGILRDVFKFISLGNPSQQMEWIIDDISEVLAATDVNKILHQYYHEGKGKDPIIHFYETFLAEYDPKTRERRGVYYTPEPVVSYIVRSLHKILKEDFNRPDGFAQASVTVLDPAAGTLTFLAEAAKVAVEEFVGKYGEGGKENLIKEHILKNFYAFELMMAPYAVGHLKMGFLLEELGYTLKKDDRFKLYLTNTLEMEDLSQTELPGIASLAEESHLANKVKKEQPILVILGNPPYSVSSANRSDFIEKQMVVYKRDVRSERNIQPLSDDYIKFIRFAHWKIDEVDIGVIGMITNNSYLSGLIHRGMRKSLLKSFSEIYILNLHGNSRIGEKSPDGSKDENVFDIQQGVSIILLIKDKNQGGLGKVFYRDVYGVREKKSEYLTEFDVKTTEWKRLEIKEPFYFFVEKDFSLLSQYEKFLPITHIFQKSSFGVTTSRDEFVVGFSEEDINNRMRTFTSSLPDDLVAQTFGLEDTGQWQIKDARKQVKRLNWKEFIKPYSYRPFDIRNILYLSSLIERDRFDIMQHLSDKENISLSLTKRLRDPIWQHVYVTENITDKTLLSSKDNCYCFPLYRYKEREKRKKNRHQAIAMLTFDTDTKSNAKQVNLTPIFLDKCQKAFKRSLLPEEYFFYIYAVLLSTVFRRKYAELLKIDLPRIPITYNEKLFARMSNCGARLVGLHLLKSTELNHTTAKFYGKGIGKVDKLRYENGKLFINNDQYFGRVEKDVWEYQIGGYQVCHKWLKDRKKRRLSLEDIKHYCNIVTALQRTIEIQKEIDKIYPDVEKELIEFPK